MLSGPFKKWRHLHRFGSIEGKQTEIIDEVDFELPYGILGKVFEGYAYKQLQLQSSNIEKKLRSKH
jgi:ligand-binding SRPBCC domain-containing protein